MKAKKQRLFKDVQFLTEITPTRNFLNFQSLQEVVNYMSNEFEIMGIKPIKQQWNVGVNEYINLIASYQPNCPKRLIVGAHYDVCGEQPGADDNASGIAGLLETARLTFENQPNIDYGIDFVAYCLEEPPFFGTKEMGSYIHAKSLYDAKVEVIGMICYDMIGYFTDEANSQNFPTKELASQFPNEGNFIMVVGSDEYIDFNKSFYETMKKGAKNRVDVQMVNFPKHNEFVGLSDQRNYWKFGYKALMINDTAFMRNPHYHKKTDTIQTLNFDKMIEVVNSSYYAIINL